MQKNIHKIKLFLQADTPEDLVKLQQVNNLVHDIMFEYEIIEWNGKLLAWYWADPRRLSGELNGD